MGSGVWPLAMATRPAKGPIGWGVMWRGEVSWCEAAGPRFHGDLLPRWRGERGSWRWARAMMLVNQADRAISTGQLRGLPRFHLRPIDVVVCHGSQRDLVLRRVSRLDAFSGYPVRT
jgi:hypothetical protein